ncbi:hypothetical protein WJX73_008857 [Symbiochloris irregularis]|uniref:Uncharacterized protein n=1 Tax=Symbiochloris irregularis TaxID=706552 RepID=A0AAW1PQ54_9CHLO
MLHVVQQVTGYVQDAYGASSAPSSYNDVTVLSNASCVLMGLFLPTLFAFEMSEFTIRLMEQATLLANLNASGFIEGNLDSLSIAW